MVSIKVQFKFILSLVFVKNAGCGSPIVLNLFHSCDEPIQAYNDLTWKFSEDFLKYEYDVNIPCLIIFTW